MSGQVSNMFKNQLVNDAVGAVYDRLEQYYGRDIDGPGDIKVSESVLRNNPDLDDNRDGRLNRTELRQAMTEDRVLLSFENAGEQNPGRIALARDMARNVINLVDGEDGVQGGQIRVSGNSIDSDSATRNLTNGSWVFGKQLGDSSQLRAQGYRVIELHSNESEPKITNP